MKYTNPILWGDYSDPDVIRVGEEFFLISSSFTYLPGIPVMHSRDLAHWELAGYAAARLPFSRYDRPAHKCGTWAPSIRYAKGKFYVYVCLPDEGLLVFTTENPAGDWECHYVKDVTGWIDPCPLFDEDGSVWLVHGLAASRCGLNNMLFLHKMSDDGLQVLDKGRLIYNGMDHGDVTVEGPKIYRRGGKYWILCPAGGVRDGYQLALRADRIEGPYERRIILEQGGTPVNGPHQGGWVEDIIGKNWFLHFQDAGAYGRVVHLQPVDWSGEWPVMGDRGYPVPGGDTGLPETEGSPRTSDDFENGLGLQWQWQANPNPAWYAALHPGIRLYAGRAENLFHYGAFCSQLMQSRNFDVLHKIQLHLKPGDMAGIGMMGYSYSYLAVKNRELILTEGIAKERNRRTPEEVRETIRVRKEWTGDRVFLQMKVREGQVFYEYGDREDCLNPIGTGFSMGCGGWTSARPGMFCMRQAEGEGGWADWEWVHFRQTGKEQGGQ